METMTSRERMISVMRGELPDRVPFFPTIYTDYACAACGHAFEDAIVNPAFGAQCMLGAARRNRTDAVRFRLGPGTAWYAEKAVVACDGRLLQIDRKTGVREGRFDVEGGGAFHPEEPPAPCDTLAAVRALPVPSAAEYLQRGCLQDAQPCIQAARRDGLFTVAMCSGQTINFMVAQLGDTATALMYLIDNPALARELIAKAVAITLEQTKAFIQTGVDCVYIGDSYASASVISPDIYEQFCAPAYREMAREIHRQGVFCYKHCCGNYNPLLERLPQIGIDAMDGIDPTSGMSVLETKRRIGAHLTLMGGISCLTLLKGTPDEVYAEARQCVLAGKPGGRYALGSACAVPRHTPPANLDAARQAAVDHGQYAQNA